MSNSGLPVNAIEHEQQTHLGNLGHGWNGLPLTLQRHEVWLRGQDPNPTDHDE